MIGMMKKAVKKVFTAYQQRECKIEYLNQSFLRFNERPVEYGFTFRQLSGLYPLRILDVGTGTTALPHLMRNCGFLVTAIDNITDYWPLGMMNRHYHVIDDDITATGLKEKFDLITCISVLEHIEDHEVAMRNMFSLLNSGGHLIVTFPLTGGEYVKNVYQLPGSKYGRNLPYICQSFSRLELNRWLADNHAEIKDQEYWQFWDGDYWTVGNQVIPPRRVSIRGGFQISCLLMKKNS